LLILLAITDITGMGWSTASGLELLVGVVLLLGFIAWERRATSPFLDFGLFRDRIFRSSSLAAFFQSLASFAVIFLVIMYLQGPRGMSPWDASLLLMPLLGFVSPMEPRWTSTLDAMTETLVSDSLVYRYDPNASPDGLRGSEGTFSLCTFFYVDALARAGRLDEARLTFEKMFTYGNHLGLYSEEIGQTGEQLGNFPQAFSHLALINAAINLDSQIEHGAGNVAAAVGASVG
jgi:hypothetical protein